MHIYKKKKKMYIALNNSVMVYDTNTTYTISFKANLHQTIIKH